MSAPQYTIRTVLDFLQVPEDRRDVCVKEFLVWLAFAEAAPVILAGIPNKQPDAFVWTDDGLHRAEFTISDGTHKATVISGRIRGFDQ